MKQRRMQLILNISTQIDLSVLEYLQFSISIFHKSKSFILDCFKNKVANRIEEFKSKKEKTEIINIELERERSNDLLIKFRVWIKKT